MWLSLLPGWLPDSECKDGVRPLTECLLTATEGPRGRPTYEINKPNPHPQDGLIQRLRNGIELRIGHFLGSVHTLRRGDSRTMTAQSDLVEDSRKAPRASCDGRWPR